MTAYENLRVLDLGTNLAGPYAAMILGDLGADVIKIERRLHGDDTRALPPQHDDQATVFLAVNRNKRSLMLDFKTPEGRAALLRLVEKADVLIESFPPGFGERYQFDYENLRRVNPRLVMCSVSAFGDGALGAQRPGYDALVQAMSGMMSLSGHAGVGAGADPIRIAPSLLDLSTGQWAAIGIMAALARRGADGAGTHVRPCLLDSAFALMCHQVLAFSATGRLPEKLGSGAPSAVPYRVYAAADQPFMLATASDAQFGRLCHVLNRPGLADDSRFATMTGRIAARNELDTLLAAEFATQSCDTWLDRLAAAGLSVGRVNDLAQALDDPLTRERELFVAPESIGWAQGLPLLRLPIDTEGVGVRRPPPRLGQHSAEILAEIGFNAAAIARLMRT